MSRLFDDGASDYLTNANAIVSAYPFTLACWFYSDNNALAQTLLGIGDTGSTNNHHYIQAAGSVAGDPVRAGTAAGGTSRNAVTSTGYSLNTWHHAAGVFASATSRAAFIDGGSKGTNTASATPTGLDTTSIGRLESSSPSNYMSGRIAEAAIWDVDLTDAEVAVLATGVSPIFVRPQNLVAYWPIVGRTSPEIDLFGRYEMTVTGTIVEVHPRIRNFVAPQVGVASAAGAALLKIINETAAVVEGVLRPLSLRRLVAETVAVVEGILWPMGLRRLVSETEAVTEGVGRPLSLRRLVAETVALPETIARLLGMSRVVNETEATTENSLRFLGFVRVVAETVAIVEGIVRQRGINRVVAETVAAVEASLRRMAMSRAVGETEAVTESTQRNMTLRRIVTETEAITEAITRFRALVRVLAETEAVSEATARLRGLLRVLTETEAITEGRLYELVAAAVADLVKTAVGFQTAVKRVVVETAVRAASFITGRKDAD